MNEYFNIPLPTSGPMQDPAALEKAMEATQDPYLQRNIANSVLDFLNEI